MDNIEARLIKIFHTIFPELSMAQIPQASQSTVATWDSIAAITLMNVMEEEFSIEIDFDRAAELGSFPAILGYLKEAQQYA